MKCFSHIGHLRERTCPEETEGEWETVWSSRIMYSTRVYPTWSPSGISCVKKERRRRRGGGRSQDRERTRQQLQYGHSHVTNTRCTHGHGSLHKPSYEWHMDYGAVMHGSGVYFSFNTWMCFCDTVRAATNHYFGNRLIRWP